MGAAAALAWLGACVLAAAAPEAPPAAALRGSAPAPGVSTGGDGATAFLGRRELPPVAGSAVLDVTATAQAQARAYFRAAVDDPALELLDTGAEVTLRGILVQQVQGVAGIPIEGTFATALLRGGALVFARHRLVAPPEVVPHASVSPAAATATALSTGDNAGMHAAGDPALTVAYFGGEARLAWKIMALGAGDAAALFVDARSGAYLGRESLRRDAALGQIVGRVNARCGGDTPVEQPLPFVQWTSDTATSTPTPRYADGGGSFASTTASSAMVVLQSPYLKMVDLVSGIGGQAAPAPLAPPPTVNTLHLDAWPQIPLDAFASFHAVRHWLVARPGLSAPQRDWSGAPLTMNLELPQHCNAYYETLGNTLNFFSAGTAGTATCVDTATVPFVVHHEYGHGIAYHSGNAGKFDLPTAEGLADTVAILSLGIERFTSLAPGCPDSGTAARSCANSLSYCPSGCTYRPETGTPKDDPHEVGQVICGAWNELRAGLVARYGSESGRAVVNALYLHHLATITGTMQDTYASIIAADDDDDDDSSNGTLHSCEINEAFATSAPGASRHFPALVPTLVPSRPSLAIAHTPPGTLAPTAEAAVLPFTLTPHPRCDANPKLQAALGYTIDGDATVRSVPLVAAGDGGAFTATLAGVRAPATVRYWVAATLDGAAFAYPFAGPQARAATLAAVPDAVQTLRLAEEQAPLYEDDFEAGLGAAVADGDSPDGRSAWEWGQVVGLGGDPAAAHSGTGVVGLHLAAGDDGTALRGATSRLTLPPLTPAAGEQVARLQFWHQRLDPTVAQVEVNGQVVYARPAAGAVPLRDYQWRFEDLDIAAAAATATPAVVRFVARQDPASVSAADAWHLDDVRVLAAAVPAAVPEAGGARFGLMGAVGCAQAGGAPATTVLVVALIAVCRRRARRRRTP